MPFILDGCELLLSNDSLLAKFASKEGGAIRELRYLVRLIGAAVIVSSVYFSRHTRLINESFGSPNFFSFPAALFLITKYSHP